ncbi:hypothetical protein ACSL103130_04790 [Actinomyces slackii]|uniref:Uncharacterized protein n=1 Tax=Actinomyces slackii TaxID=52774 RepID=A0A448KDC0_9ACTO|nr:hypothetical protein [Actinomyces slackii]VEG74936.1 Uncharacterised protein [Actinomyces slackii]
MRSLFTSRGRAIAAITVPVTSVLLAWVTWAALSEPGAKVNEPGIVMTSTSTAAQREAWPPSSSVPTPSTPTSSEAVEPAAPATVESGPAAPPVSEPPASEPSAQQAPAPAPTPTDDDLDDDDDDLGEVDIDD